MKGCNNDRVNIEVIEHVLKVLFKNSTYVYTIHSIYNRYIAYIVDIVDILDIEDIVLSDEVDGRKVVEVVHYASSYQVFDF